LELLTITNLTHAFIDLVFRKEGFKKNFKVYIAALIPDIIKIDSKINTYTLANDPSELIGIISFPLITIILYITIFLSWRKRFKKIQRKLDF